MGNDGQAWGNMMQGVDNVGDNDGGCYAGFSLYCRGKSLPFCPLMWDIMGHDGGMNGG